MQSDFLIHAPIGLLPVLIFLVILDHFDDHNLIRYYHINVTMAGGGLLAVFAYFINSQALYTLELDFGTWTRFGGPFVEECLKGGLMIYLFRTHRIGFAVDAAIRGFAVGAGFAVVENLYHLYHAIDTHTGIWIIRGFGTAIMHGGVTAIFGVVAQQMTERHSNLNPVLYLPGLAAAVTFHSIFNHFPGSPILSATGAFTSMVVTLSWLFRIDTHDINQSLAEDLKAHCDWFDILKEGRFTSMAGDNPLGELSESFPPYKLEEMHQYMSLHTRLVIMSEQRLLAWKEGAETPVGQDVRNHFNDLDNLTRDLGEEALSALHRQMDLSRQERWKLYMLKSRAEHETLQYYNTEQS